MARYEVLTKFARLAVEIWPAKLAVDTKFTRFAVDTKFARFAVETKLAKFAVETRFARLPVLTTGPSTRVERYPAVPRPITVEPSCVAK